MHPFCLPRHTHLSFCLGTMLLALVSATAKPWTPDVWREFERTGPASPLYDFSQAGYQGGKALPTPPVTHRATDFGALPNDDKDDTAALQGALDAVAKRGGVLSLAAGVYDLGLGREPETLAIAGSNVVLRGAGSGKTTLRLHQRLFKDPKKGYGDPVIQVGPAGKHNPSRWRQKLTADTPQGSDVLQVEDTTQFKVDMPARVLLFNPVVDGKRTDALSRALVAPLEPEKEWRHFARWAPVTFVSVVTEILDKNRLRLRHPAPVAFEMRWGAETGWHELPIREVGIEGIRIETPWAEKAYRHHGSREMDYGWTGIRLQHARDSWVKDVHLHNLAQDISLSGCLQSTVRETVVSGTQGHHGLTTTGWHNLFSSCQYTTTRTHGAGANGNAIGNVFRHIDFARVGGGPNAVSRLDHHGGGFPLCNLFELTGPTSVAGAGATQNMPHAGPRNVYWNIRVDASTSRPPGELFTGVWNYYATWQARGFQRADCHKLFPHSIVVGAVHADPDRKVIIDKSDKDRRDEWIHAEGISRTGVQPASLYEAQRARR